MTTRCGRERLGECNDYALVDLLAGVLTHMDRDASPGSCLGGSASNIQLKGFA